MLKLIKFGPQFGVPDPSSFVVKLETYLRLADLEYTSKNGDVRKAPKGKFPVLMDGDTPIADSQFAIDYLKEKHGDQVNDGLSAGEKAQQHLWRLGLENHTYFMLLAYRWLDKKNAPIMYETFFANMGFMGKFIFKIVCKDIRRTIKGHGILRHSWQEIDGLIAQDIVALEALLTDRPYFGGDKPREIDCTAFGLICNMIVPEMETPFRDLSRASKPLVDYHNRMTNETFPDYASTMLFKPSNS